MSASATISMQIVNNGVEKIRKGSVGILRSRKNTDFGFDVLASCIDSLLERESTFVLNVMVFFPELLSHNLLDLTSSAFGEGRHVLDHVGLGDPRTTKSSL